MRLTLLATAIGIAALTNPLHAGGPVIIEDAYEAEPQAMSFKDALPFILLGLAVAVVASGGSDSPCNGDEPTPEPGC